MSSRDSKYKMKALTSQDDFRLTYQANRVITFNETTCLFGGFKTHIAHDPIFFRVVQLGTVNPDFIFKRFASLSNFKDSFPYLFPYTTFCITDKYFYIVMEEQPHMKFLLHDIRDENVIITEKTLHTGLCPLLATLSKMHELEIFHGQINPQKIRIKDKSWYLFDALVGSEKLDDMIAENYLFLAPEIFLGEQLTVASDIWALGAVLYYFVTGHTVYFGDTIEEYIENVTSLPPYFGEECWDVFSQSFQNLIQQMLNPKPGKRITIKEIIENPWLKTELTYNSIPIQKVPIFVRDSEYEICLKKILNILANERTATEIKEIISELSSVDFQPSGLVSLGELLRICLPDSSLSDCEAYAGEMLNYSNLLNSALKLRNLIMRERYYAAFAFANKEKGEIIEEPLTTLFAATRPNLRGNIADIIHKYQRHKKDTLSLKEDEFLDMCVSEDLSLKEDHISFFKTK